MTVYASIIEVLTSESLEMVVVVPLKETLLLDTSGELARFKKKKRKKKKKTRSYEQKINVCASGLHFPVRLSQKTHTNYTWKRIV